jgi:hypothetical protein
MISHVVRHGSPMRSCIESLACNLEMLPLDQGENFIHRRYTEILCTHFETKLGFIEVFEGAAVVIAGAASGVDDLHAAVGSVRSALTLCTQKEQHNHMCVSTLDSAVLMLLFFRSPPPN